MNHARNDCENRPEMNAVCFSMLGWFENIWNSSRACRPDSFISATPTQRATWKSSF